MASIYDKALKRKDYSGIVDKEKEKAKMGFHFVCILIGLTLL